MLLTVSKPDINVPVLETLKSVVVAEEVEDEIRNALVLALVVLSERVRSARGDVVPRPKEPTELIRAASTLLEVLNAMLLAVPLVVPKTVKVAALPLLPIPVAPEI